MYKYRLAYYASEGTSMVSFKSFDTVNEAFEFLFKMPAGTLIELKYYEDSTDNGPTFWRS